MSASTVRESAAPRSGEDTYHITDGISKELNQVWPTVIRLCSVKEDSRALVDNDERKIIR